MSIFNLSATNPPIPKCAPYPTATGPCTASGNSILNPYPALPARRPSPLLRALWKLAHPILCPASSVKDTGSTARGSGNPSNLSSLLSSCSGLPICKPFSSTLGTPARVAFGCLVGMKGVRRNPCLRLSQKRTLASAHIQSSNIARQAHAHEGELHLKAMYFP